MTITAMGRFIAEYMNHPNVSPQLRANAAEVLNTIEEAKAQARAAKNVAGGWAPLPARMSQVGRSIDIAVFGLRSAEATGW